MSLVTGPAVALGLIALVAGSPGSPGRLEHVAPATLEQRGAGLTVPDSSLGFAWARGGDTLAFVAKPVATGQPIRIVDSRTFARRRLIQVGDRDVCGLAFDRGDLVALTANQPCYWAGGRFDLRRFDTRSWRLKRVIALPALRRVLPTNLAFGGGHAFVAYVGGGVDAIDLGTGAVARHRPRRSLAKGEEIVATHWLGAHRLGVGAAAVDVRTWRSRVLEPGARGIASAGADLVAYGPHGAAVYTRSGRLRFRLLGGVDLGVVRIVGRYLYAGEQQSLLAHVVDLRTRRETTSSADANLVWSLLVR